MHNFSLNHLAQNIAAFLLILFCIQYIPIESRDGVSYLKLAVSAICVLILFFKLSYISKPFIGFSIYYLLVILVSFRYPETLRWSTLLFLASFLAVYITYYNLVVIKKAFTKDFFIRLLRGLIIAYFVVLIIQHFLILVGIQIFPLFNLVQDLKRGLAGNSLSYEPSSAAIIVSFAFLSLIRMHEIDLGKKLTLKQIWSEERWATIAFLYTIFGLVSGTAMIGLTIIALYFLSSKNYVYAIIFAITIGFLFFTVDYLPLNRVRESLIAFLTLDKAQIMQADGSAAARLIPMVNTLTELDLRTLDGWLGHGVDYGLSKWIFSERVMIGGIADYGFLSFLIMQVIVYKCMIKDVISLESLLWIFLGMMTLANVPINWGAMMIFTTVRHFQTEQ